MSPDPVISVITVCYNSAATLERTLQSVAEQDWPRVQHVVIDGGSRDGTLEILERFRPRLAHVVSERDKGIYDAMNKGLDRVSGDIVCFLNADDQYASLQVLSRVAAQMREYRLDALMGDVGFFHEKDPARMVRRYRSDRFHPGRLAWGWMPAHPALFLRKEVVRRVGRFKSDYRIAGDFEFIVRAFHGHALRYRHQPEVLVHMQTGGASTAGWRAKIQLNKEVLRACRENGLRTNMLKILSKYPAKLLELLHP
ncbi:glycosyl transferase family 2 [Burkholderia sp. lig30]|jgi:glycosyltransferase involved in cell wall biosynthesis|uniref:glycosyltransferase family 2 protein n=1 Tax=Burkholderia sp. lig30 TaxID=1192124 RepID=UPI000460E218|nr:glycosyltransferase family 2 protein [Burkholderia sp. lig30]KDB08738.1 glycosyl transferase family 2 [Burkholderia sp. lig30]